MLINVIMVQWRLTYCFVKGCSYLQNVRNFSTTPVNCGKKNFKKFLLHNKRGTRLFKQRQVENPDPDIPIYHYGVRKTGYDHGGKFVSFPEMVPEIIVPDLKDFTLKPYVSYRVADVVQSEFTAKDLFDAVYRKKIVEDLKNSKLDSNGNPLEPSEEEALTSEEAMKQARQTGCDIFCEDKPSDISLTKLPF